jgi:hypothetical protein
MAKHIKGGFLPEDHPIFSGPPLIVAVNKGKNWIRGTSKSTDGTKNQEQEEKPQTSSSNEIVEKEK